MRGAGDVPLPAAAGDAPPGALPLPGRRRPEDIDGRPAGRPVPARDKADRRDSRAGFQIRPALVCGCSLVVWLGIPWMQNVKPSIVSSECTHGTMCGSLPRVLIRKQ